MKLCTIVLVVAVLSLFGCKGKGEHDKPKGAKQSSASVEKGGSKEGQDKAKKIDRRVPVEVAVIGRGVIESHIDASANLETERNVQVLSRTTNLVSELLVEEGDKVSKGQILVRLENETQRIALEKAEATYIKNTKEYERQKHLVARNLVSDQQFADITYAYKQSKLDRDNAQLSYDYTIIRAPIDGTLTLRLINLGDQVNLNQHLFDIVDFSSVVARIYLPEEHLPRLKVGQQAQIRSQSFVDKIFNGSILRISPVVDAKTGTVKVTVTMNEQDYLRPGMYVDVSLVTARKENTILLPKKALAYDDEESYIFKVVDDKAQRITVDPGIVDLEFIEPKSGLSAGDVIVVAGQNSLRDSAEVRIINPPKPETATGDKPKARQLKRNKPKDAERNLKQGSAKNDAA